MAQETQTPIATPTEKKPATPGSTPPENTPYSEQHKRQQLLAGKIKNHRAIWLKTSIGKWLSLYHQDETGKKKGILIIVPDAC